MQKIDSQEKESSRMVTGLDLIAARQQYMNIYPKQKIEHSAQEKENLQEL